MRLSDHILASSGVEATLGGFVATMAPTIGKAQRFEIGDDVARACGDLVRSRPSALQAALPLCRLPYETLWLEWRGGLGDTSRPRDGAPIPERQGVLIEAMPGGQRGFMTLAWVHTEYDGEPVAPAVNISPISIYFDWRPDGDVQETVRIAHRTYLKMMSPTMRRCIEPYLILGEQRWLKSQTLEQTAHFIAGSHVWGKFSKDPREIAAMNRLDRHMAPGLSPHGATMVAVTLSHVQDATLLQNFMVSWESDIQGEAAWVQCFLAMLNSRNPVVEHTPADLSKINKARGRRGRVPFLDYKKTRLALSRSQGRRADAAGVDREAARQHLVRGHFKIRSSGVYWWSSFLRGDAARPSKREQYDVV